MYLDEEKRWRLISKIVQVRASCTHKPTLALLYEIEELLVLNSPLSPAPVMRVGEALGPSTFAVKSPSGAFVSGRGQPTPATIRSLIDILTGRVVGEGELVDINGYSCPGCGNRLDRKAGAMRRWRKKHPRYDKRRKRKRAKKIFS